MDTHKERIAVIGVNQESLNLLSFLIAGNEYEIVKVFNPETEPFTDLLKRQIDIIIDATGDRITGEKLRQLPLDSVDILNPLSARILLCNGRMNGSRKIPMLLRSLRDIAAAIRLTKDKDEIMGLVLNLAIQAVGADSGSIMLLDRNKRNLKIEMACGLDASVAKTVVQKIGKGISGTVAKSKTPLLTQGPVNPDRIATDIQRRDIYSSICSPLIYDRDVIGVLNVASKHVDRIFCEDDLANVADISQFTAEIIQTSRTFTESAASHYSLSLYNTVRDIMALQFPFEERLHLAAMKIANTFKAETCNIYEYTADSNTFISRAASSYEVVITQGENHRLHDFFGSQILKTRSRVVHTSPSGSVFILEPVFIDTEIWGVLLVHLEKEDTASAAYGLLMEKLAHIIAAEIRMNRQISGVRTQVLKYSALAEMIFELTTKQTLGELVKKIISNACFILEAETCIFRRFDPCTLQLKHVDHVSSKAGFNIEQLDTVDMRITNDAINMGTPILIKDFESSIYRTSTCRFSSVLCSPLRAGENALGTLSVYEKRPGRIAGRRFNELDKALFNDFCAHASKAIMRCLDGDVHELTMSTGAGRLQPTRYIRPGVVEYDRIGKRE